VPLDLVNAGGAEIQPVKGAKRDAESPAQQDLYRGNVTYHQDGLAAIVSDGGSARGYKELFALCSSTVTQRGGQRAGRMFMHRYASGDHPHGCRRAAGAVTSSLACGRLALSSRAALVGALPPGWSP
jgi:hypothetical protein